MNIDRFARQTHRRGVLAALAALAIPATGKAHFEFGRCSPRGGGCTLNIHCCGNVTCYREPLNPNSGVCGIRQAADGPGFILPSHGGGSGSGSSGGGGRLTDSQIVARYDRNRSGDIDCGDFRCRAEAQALHDAYPGNTWRLDGDGDGVACEVYPYPETC